MRKVIIVYFAFIFAYAISFKPLMAQTTIPYFSGIPVMQGFEVVSDSILVFDKPQGQIAQVSMICNQYCPTETDLNSYYNDVLLSLGWLQKAPALYQKNDHIIRYDYVTDTQGQAAHLLTFLSE